MIKRRWRLDSKTSPNDMGVKVVIWLLERTQQRMEAWLGCDPLGTQDFRWFWTTVLHCLDFHE